MTDKPKTKIVLWRGLIALVACLLLLVMMVVILPLLAISVCCRVISQSVIAFSKHSIELLTLWVQDKNAGVKV